MPHLVAAELGMFGHFYKISLLWEFRLCPSLWLSGSPTLSVFHLQKNCCYLWSAHVTVTFPPCLASFVVLFLECQVVEEENTNGQFTVFEDLNSINYLSGGADVHSVFCTSEWPQIPSSLHHFFPFLDFLREPGIYHTVKLASSHTVPVDRKALIF